MLGVLSYMGETLRIGASYYIVTRYGPMRGNHRVQTRWARPKDR
jgi:hypothetical protein